MSLSRTKQGFDSPWDYKNIIIVPMNIMIYNIIMGTAKHLREEAIKLRFRGRSYGEILKELNISSKGTLNYWFRNLEIPPSALKKLEGKILLARERGLLSFNEKRTRRIIDENKKIFNEAIKESPKISKNYLSVIGAALYWGEGSIREQKGRYPIVSFSNSDPQMIRVFMCYLRDCLGVNDNKIKVRVQIHPNIKAVQAKKFWSKITKLPEERFGIFEQISRASKLKRRINFLPYGTLDIRVNNRQLFYKVKGSIIGIANQFK